MSKRSSDVASIANTSKKQKNIIDFNLEEDVIKYYPMSSLQHASMIFIIITLWNQADIKYQIVKIFNEYEYGLYTNAHSIYRLFLKIKDNVLDKVLQLPVPNRIKKILSNFVHPVGKEIFDWIMYQDKYIFNTCYNAYPNSKSIAINYIHYLVWTARGIIDYPETAKTSLSKEEKLSDSYKYNIACAYCFEDNISIIAPKVINTTLTLSCIERQAMVYFWTAHITGDFIELNKAVYIYNSRYSTNYSRNECIFKVLTDDGANQVAIKYLWDKLSDEEKSRQIVPAIKKTPNTDIRCFLLSQMNKEQEKEVFKEVDAQEILLGFLDDWLWGQYFLPTMHHIWDILSGNVYLCVLEDIVNKMKSYGDTKKYKSIFKELWQYAPKHLKEYVFELERGRRYQRIFFSLFSKGNIDVIQSILSDFNDVQKKQIIFSHYAVDRCHFLITSDQWDLLEMLISHTLFSRQDVESFKKVLVEKNGRELPARFLQNKEWNKVEQLLQWAFKSDDDIREFKSKLAYSKICDNILESIVESNKADFMDLEYLFEWCASGNAKRVVELKKGLPRLYFHGVICKLIEEDKYELLEQLLNWCFINDPKHTAQFKEYFYNGGQFYEIKNLIVNLIERDDNLQSITKFVNWCCNSSQIRIDNFKNKLMIGDDVLEHLSKIEDPAELIAWFNPSTETILKFKEKFENYFCFRYVLSALDNYVQKQQHNKERVINKDENDKDISDVANQEKVHCFPTEHVFEKQNLARYD